MKRAFDDNVPRVKPRVRFGTADADPAGAPSESFPEAVKESFAGTPGEPGEDDLPEPASSTFGQSPADVHAAVDQVARSVLHSAPTEIAASVRGEALAPANRGGAARPSELVEPEPAPIARQALESTAKPAARAPAAHQPPPPPPAAAPRASRPAIPAEPPKPRAVEESPDDRDDRRRKLRARLWAIQNPVPPLPQGAARVPEVVVAVAEGLTQQLSEARARADRLEHELGRARADLARAVAEAEAERSQVDSQRSQLSEARTLLGGLESELSMLEEERDEVLAEVRSLRQADGARRESLTALNRELDQSRRFLTEARAEQAEIVRELESGDAENLRLRQELSRVEAEKARLLEQLTELSGAKGELQDSRRTLERVHRLLAVASTPSRVPRS